MNNSDDVLNISQDVQLMSDPCSSTAPVVSDAKPTIEVFACDAQQAKSGSSYHQMVDISADTFNRHYAAISTDIGYEPPHH